MQYIDPRELNDLAALASRGGLGQGIALTDCVAETPDQLMYIKGDELILLRELGDILLASCEGVVGWVKRADVRFDSLAGASSSPRQSHDLIIRNDLPRTVLTEPSPPMRSIPLPEAIRHGGELDAETMDPRRISGPFELESPQLSPGVEKAGTSFFDQQYVPPQADTANDNKRESMASIASSEALGGIGGFMMGGDGDDGRDSDEELEELREDVSPATASINTPFDPRSSSSSPTPGSSPRQPTDEVIRPISEATLDNESDWDIYGDYARDSMYGPKRISMGQKRASHAPKNTAPLPEVHRFSVDVGAVHAARAALQTSPPAVDGEETVVNSQGGVPPVINAKSPNRATAAGQSLATQLRLKIQLRENEAAIAESEEGLPSTGITRSDQILPAFTVTTDDTDTSLDEIDTADTSIVSPDVTSQDVDVHDESTDGHLPSESSTFIESPDPPKEMTFTAPSPPPVSPKKHTLGLTRGHSLLASPIPLEQSDTEAAPSQPSSPAFERRPSLIPLPSPSLNPPHPPLHSPSLSPNLPRPAWSPHSPSSPHSVAATRQAVDAVNTPEGKRSRGLTLVGRMDADLGAAKGPVPITFVVGGAEIPGAPGPRLDSIGLGMPSSMAEEIGRSDSPGLPEFPDRLADIRNSPSRFPMPPKPMRSVTTPVPPVPATATANRSAIPPTTPAPVERPSRPRSRSFSAAFTRSSSRAKNANTAPLSISTASPPPLPSMISPALSTTSKRSFFSRKSSAPSPAIHPTPPQSPSVATMPASVSSASTQILSRPTIHSNDSSRSLGLPNPPARSSNFSFTSKSSPKTTRTLQLASPVSHKDFAEETVKADGMDFEIVQPRSITSMSASEEGGNGSGLERKNTLGSLASSSSLRALPETDEWGYLKDRSPVPEIFGGRVGAGKNREGEQKWLSIISTPLPSGTAPPKKVRKIVLESGVPSSLRGKVWAWFMSSQMSARVPGLYQELLDHDKGQADEQIERDVATGWSDHSVFAEPNCPGRQDLRSLLRAYSNFAPNGYQPTMSLLAGTLLIHCVGEDAFWLLSGLVNGALKDYYSKEITGMKVDGEVFKRGVEGSEKDLAGLFKAVGLHPMTFLERWYRQLFVRCLPWPTALRVIDAVVAEGPRFLLVAALTILTVSRERLLALPRTSSAIMEYLMDLPQDSLLLPETFMRASEKVKFKEEDLAKLRGGVRKDMGV